ncbi:MAG: hypothetical protein HYY30_02745 [Chloroflexi bacterium]|nr:hypothetical protein [Chloroflexota bacterium]
MNSQFAAPSPDGPALDASLLAAKLCIPPLRPHLIARPRLMACLDEIAHHNLALIAAPAGYGKTTLLAEWARQSHWRVGWLSLDPGDNDIGHFLRYVVAAWATIEQSIQEGPLGVLAWSLLPSIDKVLAALANEAAARIEPFVLVLDDYHVIAEPAIHDALAFVVDHLPPQMHLVVTSRTDPPLPLARWRAHSKLIELRADTLRFTAEETVQLFTRASDPALPIEDVTRLAERAEGWIAGLQLAALSLRGRDRLLGQIEALSGKDRYVADYLAAEVLGQQTESIRAFLLETSILNHLCGPLCAAVTGRTDSQAMLEALEQANLFLSPLDNTRQWYRYHQIFAEFLHHELQKREAEALAILHRRASAWFAEHDFPDEAFHHAITGEDFDQAARIVEGNLPLKLGYGHYRVVAEWLQALPRSLFKSRPVLGLFHGLFLLQGGQIEACLKSIEEVERHIDELDPPDKETRVQKARIAGMRAILACFQNDLASAVKFSGQVFRDLPADDLFFRFGVNIALGDTYRRGSQWTAAIVPYSDALNIARRTPVPCIAIHPLSALGDLYMMQGRLRRASEFRLEALQLIADQANRAGITIPLMGWAHIRMGELLYEWDNLDGALDHLQKGLALAELGGDTQALVFGHLARGQVALARGDVEGAASELWRARPLVEGAQMPEWTNQLHQFQVQLWLAQGDLSAAVDWAETTHFAVDEEASYRYEIVRLALARVLIAQGEREANAMALDRALVLLHRLLHVAEVAGRKAVVIEALTLQAVVYRAGGNPPRAFSALERALQLAEPEGYLRLFADLGATVAGLLQEARSRGLAPHYVIKLLAAIGVPGTHAPAHPPTAAALPDPLSEREREVLRLVEAGLSNSQIAEQLIIAVGTVKRHVATIYEKLGVNSRTQAVARARELHILQQ